MKAHKNIEGAWEAMDKNIKGGTNVIPWSDYGIWLDHHMEDDVWNDFCEATLYEDDAQFGSMIYDWLRTEVGEQEVTWYFEFFNNTLYFLAEEDKVRFILRWL